MPYPNEHAARVRNPGSFEPNSFRSKELKDGVRLILGKLKGGNGSMIVQAYRFSVDKFTVEQAKKWLEDNKIKFISFEPAKPVSEAEENAKNKIAHTGVLGMKWGRRTGSGSRGHSTKNRNTSEDFKSAVAIKKKHISEMSNDEVLKVVKRMELEKRYKDLNPSKIAKGQKRVGSVFSSIGKIAGTAGSIVALATIGKTLWDKVNGHMDAQLAKAFVKGF